MRKQAEIEFFSVRRTARFLAYRASCAKTEDEYCAAGAGSVMSEQSLPVRILVGAVSAPGAGGNKRHEALTGARGRSGPPSRGEVDRVTHARADALAKGIGNLACAGDDG